MKKSSKKSKGDKIVGTLFVSIYGVCGLGMSIPFGLMSKDFGFYLALGVILSSTYGFYKIWNDTSLQFSKEFKDVKKEINDLKKESLKLNKDYSELNERLSNIELIEKVNIDFTSLKNTNKKMGDKPSQNIKE